MTFTTIGTGIKFEEWVSIFINLYLCGLILYAPAVYLGENLLTARTTRQSMIEHYLDLTTARGREAMGNRIY